jgi:quercetin dioxygenase-like cupin family protein
LSSVQRAVLEARLRAEGLDPSVWSNLPGHRYEPHDHGYDKVLVAVEGEVTFGLIEEGRKVVLTPGERLDLPAHTRHDAVVGRGGVTCLEAHRPPGSTGPRATPRGLDW